MEELGARPAARLLERLAAGDRRRRARRRAAARARRARGRARPADRLRGARLGPPRQRRTSTRGGSSQQADHPALGTCLDSFHILSRGSRPGAHPRDPRREDLLPAARRRAAAGDGRPAVEPPLPLLPGPGRLRPSRTSAATCSPPATTGRSRWRSSTTSSARPTRDRMAVDAMRSLLVLEDALASLPGAARRLRVRRARRPRRSSRRAAARARAGQHRTKPVQLWLQDGAASSSTTTAPGDPARRRDRARRADARTAGRARGRARPTRCAAARTGRPSSSRPPTAAGAGSTSRDSAPHAAASGSTTSRSRSRSTTSTRPRSSTARCSACARAGHELAAPDGLVRSRARSGEAACGSRSTSRAAGRPVRSSQHVAFACGDVLRRRAPMRDAGVPAAGGLRQLLRRPRRPHRPRPGERSRSCASSASSTTRDERRRAPALLHRARRRPPVLRGVERRGGYDGYGAANSAVRLGAQGVVADRV